MVIIIVPSLLRMIQGLITKTMYDTRKNKKIHIILLSSDTAFICANVFGHQIFGKYNWILQLIAKEALSINIS